jgi:hypothetical protein
MVPILNQRKIVITSSFPEVSSLAALRKKIAKASKR